MVEGFCERCQEYCDACESPSCPLRSAKARRALFDADELGLDPETDNCPGDPTRYA